MDSDDLEPAQDQAGRPAAKRDLHVMSIEQLQDYIAEMEVEIARVRAAIADKESARGAADSVFKI